MPCFPSSSRKETMEFFELLYALGPTFLRSPCFILNHGQYILIWMSPLEIVVALDLLDTRRRNIHRPTSISVSGGSPSRILMEKSITSDLKFKMTTLCQGTQRKIRLSIKREKIIHIGNDIEIYVVQPFCLRSQEKEPRLFNLSLSLSHSCLTLFAFILIGKGNNYIK